MKPYIRTYEDGTEEQMWYYSSDEVLNKVKESLELAKKAGLRGLHTDEIRKVTAVLFGTGYKPTHSSVSVALQQLRKEQLVVALPRSFGWHGNAYCYSTV